jgi:hypothetical protein
MQLSDKSSLDFKLDFSSAQVVVSQKSELGIETGRIMIPMADIKDWGTKFKGITSFLSLDLKK